MPLTCHGQIMTKSRAFLPEYQHTNLPPDPFRCLWSSRCMCSCTRGLRTPSACSLVMCRLSWTRRLLVDGLAAAVKAIRAFWDTEIPNSTLAGRTWRALLDKAAAMPLSDSASGYKAKLDELLEGLGCFLRAAE